MRNKQSVAVIGAGVAGLSCAIHLERAGHRVQLLEGSGSAGGRVRTDVVEGFRLDRGFQVLLTAYPEANAMLDLPALQLGRFAPGAMIRRDDRFATVADPLRRPGLALRTLFSGVATPGDALRILRLQRRVARSDASAQLEAPSRASIDWLRAEGFSERIIESFFRPFLGGVLLDRSLTASSRSLQYLFRMFAQGDAALPARGMQAIPEQLASRLANDTLRLRARVAQIDPRQVVLESGERIDASAVVIATEAHAASKLVNGLEVPDSNPAACLSFDAPAAPPVGDFLLLDGNDEGPINELCVPSNVAPGYAPAGRALVSASVLAPIRDEDETLEAQARRQLRGWFGAAVDGWRLLRIDRIQHALPAQPPGPFEPRATEPRLAERLFICGDHRDLASLQGAMASGRRAAEAVHEALH